MKAGERVRRGYEERPYPFGDKRALTAAAWKLNLDWVRTFGGATGAGWPRRVLVAGCGDGSEAFALQRRLPRSEVVAVDFSRRSIALARRIQQETAWSRRIRFLVADLAQPGLAAQLGAAFDLITCHGVLSYIPDLGRTLANLRRCLAPAGVLYLGVNGAGHVGVRLRAAFPLLGLRPDEYRGDEATLAALRLADAVVESRGFPQVAAMGPAFLASDIFSTLNHSLSLEDWLERAGAAGLHLRSCASSASLVRRVQGAGLLAGLQPRSRSEIAELLGRLDPAQFHRLLFTRAPEVNPPWEQARRLRYWSLERSPLYRARLPRLGRAVRDRLRRVRLTSSYLRIDVEWRMPEWEIALLQQAESGRPLARLLADLPLAIPFADLQAQLYLLHQLGIVTLRPPPAA